MANIIDEDRIKESRFGESKFDGSTARWCILIFIVGMIFGILIGDTVKALFKELTSFPAITQKNNVQPK